MALHVIVGKGPVGLTTAELLADRGHRVRVLSRSGGTSTDRVEHRRVARGAEDHGAAGLGLTTALPAATGVPVARGTGSQGDCGERGRRGGEHALGTTLHRGRPAFSALVGRMSSRLRGRRAQALTDVRRTLSGTSAPR